MVWITLSYKLDAEIHEMLKRVCRARGENISTFTRRAVLKELAMLGLLSAEDCKALGLSGESSGQKPKPQQGVRGASKFLL